MHGFLTTSKPSGGKLKGDEFQRVKKVLAGISQPDVSHKARAAGLSDSPASSTEASGETILARVGSLGSCEFRSLGFFW
ncbi:MAG: hypothetical protein DWI29_04790 [Planctomycetota bacterium]|nr:MAG: hypothetical protein DWI29_04790 [Planctomycetota bacterium]